jgi:GNAT superfamily N-acetyltransferase
MPSKKRTIGAAVRSKPKPNQLRAVNLESPFLELMSTVMPTWNNPEPDAYITPLTGNVCIPSGGDDECKIVGKISAYSIHLGNASEDGVSWFEVLDSHSADVALYLSLFDAEARSCTDWVESNLEPYSSDLLILDRIRIEPEYRGRGYGLYAAELMIQTFGPSGGLAACVPAPYELLQKYELSSIEDAIRLSREERIPEWGPAETKLRKFWSLLGFQAVPGSDVFALSLSLRRPPMHEIIQTYFERKSVPTSRIQ